LIFVKVLVSRTVEYCGRKAVIYFAAVTNLTTSNQFRPGAGRQVRSGIARYRTRADGSSVRTTDNLVYVGTAPALIPVERWVRSRQLLG